MSMRRTLPIGIQSFAKLRTQNCYYVDKTHFAWQLSQQAGYFFLSRPRRFGKSLFLDTLKELFEGNEPLFRGLYIHPRWDWQQRYPVVRLSFSDGLVRSAEDLAQRIGELLQEQAERLGVSLTHQSIAGRFSELLRLVHARQGAPVVVLIDEYDKPILDNLSDPALALQLRDGLRDLYSVLKGADPHLRFCLLTGVSKFSKVSLFSGLNNLNDITLDPAFSALCGYTEADLEQVFAPELDGLDRDAIRRWYNGYRWLGESVYNPFDVLLLLQKRQFRAWWFETGTPSFLVQLLAERGWFTPQLERLQSSEMLLGRFDVQDIGTEALLFQAGYLTIRQAEESLPGQWLYTLGYPNLEVEVSLNEALLPAYGLEAQPGLQNRIRLLQALRVNDFATLEQLLRALYAGLPHDWYRNNPIARYEGHYASIFYSHLAALGLDLRVEDAGSSGQVDLTLTCNGQYYLFEFKVVEQVPQGRALAQLQARGYADKYRASGQPIHLIGVEFSRDQRRLVGFEVFSL